MNAELTQERLKYLLTYCRHTGIFTWNVEKSNRARVGDNAGHLGKQGYLIIGIDRVTYLAHRLAWLYVFGYPIPKTIDHMNMNKTDNIIENLMSATSSTNLLNRIHPNKNNKTGSLGVHYEERSNRWRATITVNRKHINIGRYCSQEQASLAYASAKAEYVCNGSREKSG